MGLIEEINNCVIKGHVNAQSNYPQDLSGKPGVEELVNDAITQKVETSDILHKGLISGMEVVGDKFSKGEYFVPEMLFSAKAMKAGLKILEPLLIDQNISTIGTVIIGTVEGDMHDIGKNLVAMMLEGAGFEVIDLGVDVAPAAFVETAAEKDAAIIAISALLTTTMTSMADVVALKNEKALSSKVLIGGAPLSLEYCREIGADGYGVDARSAVVKARELVGS